MFENESINKDDILVVILCGGKGTRLREETERVPKPIVPIGGKPILWHIMKIYSEQGYKKFILLLGYKSEKIKEFFLNYPWSVTDFNMKLGSQEKTHLNNNHKDDWEITFLDTGLESLTERRLFLAKKLLQGEGKFMLTYGDGVADINLDDLMKFHNSKDVVLSITGVKSRSKQGKITHSGGMIKSFSEKPILDDLINGGFMVFDRKIFDYISEENVMMEFNLIPKLVNMGKVGIFEHRGFWHSMDTYQDKINLDKIWNNGAPWKIWREEK